MADQKITSNEKNQEKVSFEVLSEDQIKDIHGASLEILEKTGVNIYSEEARKLLKDGGCWLEEECVHFPPDLVEWAIDSAPSHMMLYDRKGENTTAIGGNNVTFGLGPTLLKMRDLETGERRDFVKKDTADAVRACDALSNIDWVMGLGTISNVPRELSDRYEFETMVKNTTKPIVVWSYTVEGVEDILEMASAVRGSKKDLIDKPFIISYSEPISPLMNDEDATKKLLLTAEHGIPTIHTPIPQSGASAPVTIAGQLAQGNAENLASLVISQLKREGLPFFVGGVFSIMDMKSATLAYGAPEMDLSLAAYMDIADYYGLPTWGTAGCSDSKLADEQAAIEATLSSLFSALSGANLVHDVGYLESATTGSLELITMVDEIVGMVKRFTEGIEVNEDTLATDVIEDVGHGGNYLTHEHTMDHFKEASWTPSLMDRQVRESWESDGGKTLQERANERAKEIIADHEPEELEDEAKAKIDKVIQRLEG